MLQLLIDGRRLQRFRWAERGQLDHLNYAQRSRSCPTCPDTAEVAQDTTALADITNKNYTIDGVAPCYYCRGTLIRTDGVCTDEELDIGELVMTKISAWRGQSNGSGGDPIPDVALGRAPACRSTIKAGALDENVPRRDLWISPHHAMYLDGVLIEAINIVNGVSIVQPERVDKIEYFHIELESHDVIFAEGAMSGVFPDDERPLWTVP